ncbi:hypothetical protein [Catellatospora bangladeshensis]|uniref:Uncharacterized protein n=1 Tax=Catellatospora bangladeshensis TaxID=310355 RepID=A0A8J3JJW4_9ACTN|nr:hypothetical protein [Catellatospora bangladeshensis]GIF86241.1 hypothetical protein Cba03nite_75900 [Catellatospora bangladeshensis]
MTWLRRTGAAATAAGLAAGACAALVPLGAAQAGPGCTARFSASAQADVLRLRALDLPILRDRPLADLRLASATGAVDSASAQPAVAAAHLSELAVLGIDPGEPAVSRSIATTAGSPGPHETRLSALNAPGLLDAEAGRLTSDASWRRDYRCGQTGPLTRAATGIGSLTLLPAGGGAVSAGGADGSDAGTSLLRVRSAGASQAFTELVRLPGNRVGVAAGAGSSLAEVSLFDGTAAEVSVKVVSQPKLLAVAGGSRARSLVDYRPAVLEVTAAGRPVAHLSAEKISTDVYVNASLRGRTPTRSLLSVRVSIGELVRTLTDSAVSAEAATVRVQLLLGKAVILDTSLGHLSVAATSARSWPATGPAPQAAVTDAGRPKATVVTASPSPSPAATAPALAPAAASQSGGAPHPRAATFVLAAAVALLATGAVATVRRRRGSPAA